jgi:hypothetical protein
MKKILITLAFIFIQVSYAQVNKTISIDWVESEYNFIDNYNINVPNFKSDSFQYNDINKTIFYQQKFLEAYNIDEKSLKISNLEFENISESMLGVLNKKLISKDINAAIINSMARDVNYVVLSFQPIIKEGNSYKRVKSLSISYSIGGVSMSEISRNINTLSNSVLKSGVFKKFYVEKSGVYRLDKAFLSQLGFNANVDPRTIKIYGNGGRMLPLLNSIPYPNDLAENSIYFKGEQDGVFDDSDYILFYAEGVDNWSEDSETYTNIYSDKSYYYITSSAANGKRISPIVESTQAPIKVFTTFDDEVAHEVDRVNIVRLGRKWAGEQFNINPEQSFNFSFPNIDVSSPVSIKINVLAVSQKPTYFNVKVNNQDLGNVNLDALINGSYRYSTDNTFLSSLNVASPNVSVLMKYNNNGVPNGIGYLDYITLKCKSFLKGNGFQYRFTVNEVATSIGTAEYQISNASSIGQVWDITDIYNVTSKENAGLPQMSFKTVMGENKNYIIVDNNNFYTPIVDSNSNVINQDLKGTIFLNNQGVFEDIDYIIVTPQSLRGQAERLANFHRTYSKLNVKVVSLESLYEEFSSGKQDIGAIRNFVKYVYENASTPSRKVKYLCLFGDASFDFKNRIPNNTNIVPIFQSLNSDSISSSFISDDYFGLMNPDEGYVDSQIYRNLDIAVGRILASSETQADQLVSKIIDYHDIKAQGKWRNNIVMISDDSDVQSDTGIQKDLDDLSNEITFSKPFMNVKKIHSDSYVQETTSGGQKYPKVREEFINSFEQGSLVIDYFGHGNEDGLSAEKIYYKNDALGLVNKYKYPLFITVTCDFTRFDNPYRDTGGEFTYWNPIGGAIAMVTTTRLISQGGGSNFNKNLSKYLFSYGSDVYPSIAESVRLTKVASGSIGNNVVFYIGDPALQLAIPKPKVKLTKLNDVDIASTTETLSGLSYVKLSGEVTDESDNLLPTYNGELAINIYDKEINRTTLGNDGITQNGVLSLLNFTTLGETIFRGNASVVNGKFEFGFVVPKDIKIPVGNGKVSFYAKENGTVKDKTGYSLGLKIGGLNANAVADNTAPKIRLYMNNESFVSGGITNQSPLFLAFLEDEHGINTASGIGHDIVAYLDGDETKPYILNDYYETELNDYTKGKLKFPFRDLALGLHTLTFKAWDVYNNIVTSELQFIVVGDETLTLSNVLNYPNPFINHTEFWFTHNRPFEPLEVQVQVFTIAGKVVWTKNQLVNNDGFLSRELTWDGRDDFGDKIGKGVYVYKLTVRSTLTNKKTEKFEKLVIL